LHDVITSICRNAGFSLNVVHEVDNAIASLTMVTTGLGLAFCSPAMRTFWPDIAFRPFLEAAPALEYAVGYRGEAQSPLLDSFLKSSGKWPVRVVSASENVSTNGGTVQ
jgi:hypothetical protein